MLLFFLIESTPIRVWKVRVVFSKCKAKDKRRRRRSSSNANNIVFNTRYIYYMVTSVHTHTCIYVCVLWWPLCKTNMIIMRYFLPCCSCCCCCCCGSSASADSSPLSHPLPFSLSLVLRSSYRAFHSAASFCFCFLFCFIFECLSSPARRTSSSWSEFLTAVCRLRFDDIEIHVYIWYIYRVYREWTLKNISELQWISSQVNLPAQTRHAKHDGKSCMQPNLIRGNLRRVAHEPSPLPLPTFPSTHSHSRYCSCCCRIFNAGKLI